MSIFQEVKDLLRIEDVVDFYGIELNRNYKARCPFHAEKTASFSVKINKQIFNCFGCNTGGDLIKFVELMFNLKGIEAVKRLNSDFNLNLSLSKPNNKQINEYKARKKKEQLFESWKAKVSYMVDDIFKYLYNCKPCDKMRVDNLDKIEYLCELFVDNNNFELLKLYKNHKKELKNIERLHERVNECRFFGI